MSRTEDQRRHPRVTERLTVHSGPGGAARLETINLSAGGLSCQSPAYLAPMTRLALALELPAPGGNGAALVEGEAVVVRTDPPQPSAGHEGGYRIALFFSRMEEKHRRSLHEFLASRTAPR
jgi:hypothetical protein